ncbi:MAG: hypothetical protein ACXVHU_01545 [Methanobacterium sp.]
MENKVDILDEIKQKEDLSENIADNVINNAELLHIILDGVYSDITRVKFRSAKILKIISGKNPELLYPYIDFFIELLDSENKIITGNAMDIIANLSAVDSEKKIDRIFDKYYGFINDESMVTAAHVVDNSWKIAKSKPEYKEKVTNSLLELENIPRDAECKNILLGKAILSFDKYFTEIENKKEVTDLVKKQLKNPRNATKVKALKFLRKHPE